MMNQVYNTLPDDRPITSIGVVEDPEKCPSGYYVVSRTHDQDSDADLWKDGFFGRKVTRYLCLSKTEGVAEYIVESTIIINDKEAPPDGFSLLPRTMDSEQRAWRKRQLCYRLSNRSVTTSAVTDVIVLSRMKKAPEGFCLAGEINGLTICFKLGPASHVDRQQGGGQLAYSLSVNSPYQAPPDAAHPVSDDVIANGVLYPSLSGDGPQVCVNPLSLRPSRPAPRPPGQTPSSFNASRSFATLASFQDLEGVPFILSPKFQSSSDSIMFQIPVINCRTTQELNREFCYDFRIEHET